MPTKEQRQNKQFVEKLLRIQGKDYDEWLDNLHVNFIQENNKIIFDALDSKLNKGEKEKSNENSQSLDSTQDAINSNSSVINTY